MFNSVCRRAISVSLVAIPLIGISCAPAQPKVDEPQAILHSTTATLTEVLTGHRASVTSSSET